jgi:energy-coupling factor transporter ATP-binding protein EcfA2
METLKVRNLGPIAEADIRFGDLTFFVGPQASGKSIVLQLVKLLVDKGSITHTLNKYGYVWDDAKGLLELFYGEGMSNIWNADTEITVDGSAVEPTSLLDVEPNNSVDTEVFYIPAQRVVTVLNGWPRPFSDFGWEPFVLKTFSESLRIFMEIGKGEFLFRSTKNSPVRDKLYRSVFQIGDLEIDVSDFRKRFVLNIDGNKIPISGWSAGQREFMPLWMGINSLFISKNGVRPSERILIVEEPEMGLHPQAIVQVILELLKLIRFCGFKVVVSTHSPVFLEFAWAFQLLKRSGAPEDAMYELFNIKKSAPTKRLFTNIMKKTINAYYFNRGAENVVVKDISSMDAGSDDEAVSEWGGLSSFASRSGSIVSKYAADEA